MSFYPDHAYEGVRRVVYGEGLTFVPVCEKCARFVKPDAEVMAGDESGLSDEPNATCKRCGRTRMLFEGWV